MYDNQIYTDSTKPVDGQSTYYSSSSAEVSSNQPTTNSAPSNLPCYNYTNYYGQSVSHYGFLPSQNTEMSTYYPNYYNNGYTLNPYQYSSAPSIKNYDQNFSTYSNRYVLNKLVNFYYSF
jgi:hypothetical protein